MLDTAEHGEMCLQLLSDVDVERLQKMIDRYIHISYVWEWSTLFCPVCLVGVVSFRFGYGRYVDFSYVSSCYQGDATNPDPASFLQLAFLIALLELVYSGFQDKYTIVPCLYQQVNLFLSHLCFGFLGHGECRLACFVIDETWFRSHDCAGGCGYKTTSVYGG